MPSYYILVDKPHLEAHSVCSHEDPVCQNHCLLRRLRMDGPGGLMALAFFIALFTVACRSHYRAKRLAAEVARLDDLLHAARRARVGK